MVDIIRYSASELDVEMKFLFLEHQERVPEKDAEACSRAKGSGAIYQVSIWTSTKLQRICKGKEIRCETYISKNMKKHRIVSFGRDLNKLIDDMHNISNVRLGDNKIDKELTNSQ